MRVAVIDIGTNTTRLLVADVDGDELTELERRTIVTALGQGVDATGRLAPEAMKRVSAAIGEYRGVINELGAERITAIATSAMRDAENGPAFRDELKDRFGVDARTISGDEEARLTFKGATAGREDEHQTVVIDIGGGSTEYVLGQPGQEPDFHVSTQMGSVRHTERFLRGDPPSEEELAALARDVRATAPEISPEHAVAVAGTATSLASIDGAADVHGYVISTERCGEIAGMLAALPVDARRQVPGLNPARAPTIVAGAVILTESLRAFGLDEVEISDRDILHGSA